MPWEGAVHTTPASDPWDRAVASAVQILLRDHTPDAEGWCRGCLTIWGRLVSFDHCTQARWATAMLAADIERAEHDSTPPQD
jgi:hypothetical protein